MLDLSGKDGEDVRIGLGEAILRLVKVQFQSHLGFGDHIHQNKEETDILTEALNQYELVISFACDIDGDGIPDTTMKLIAKSAETKVKKGVSCCRIKHKNPLSDTQTFAPSINLSGIIGQKSEEEEPPKKKPVRKKRTSNRRKK